MVTLTGNSLTMEQMKSILFEMAYGKASEDSLVAVKECREKVEEIVNNGKVVYGITTGFGKFSDVLIEKENVSKEKVSKFWDLELQFELGFQEIYLNEFCNLSLRF